MGWHVELINPDQSVEYVGAVDDPHVGEVRGIGALEESNRWVKPHPRKDDEFFVIRDDGLLEHYVQEGAVPEDSEHETEQGAGEEPVGASELMGASGPAYISGAERLGGQSIGGAMDYPGNPPRVVHHTTESGSGSGYFTSCASYLRQVSSEPQVLYDPVSDRLGQFGPLNQSGRALKNESGGRRTNREGKVCIQIEVCARAASPWTNGWDPAKKPNWQKFIAACRAWGVPDVWPNGVPVKYPPGSKSRSVSTWHSKGGHYGHQDVPGNDHGDPGAVDTGKMLYGGGKGSTVARYRVRINGLEYGYGASGPQVTLVGKKLVERGFGKHYAKGPGPDWSDADTLNYQDFQLSLGLEGTEPGGDADGVPGEGSLKKLLGRIPAAADFDAADSGEEEYTSYTVVKGDTLSRVAVLYDSKVADLVKLNKLKDADSISVGQKLKVPKPKSAIVTVKKGDTLYSIAKAHKTTVEKLKSKNSLKSDTIVVGQLIKIP